MVILGFLSIFQVVFLPGLIVTLFLRTRTILQRILLAFAFSLLINHFLVIVLVLLGIFTQPVVWAIFLIELLTLFFILRYRHITIPYKTTWSVLDMSCKEIPTRSFWSTFVLLLIGLFSVISLWIVITKVLSTTPGVFNLWDDFTSFNRWALDWYSGIFPLDTNYYPQLISAVWSMVYKFIGNSDIQFFAKGIMGLFPIFLLLIFVDLFYRLRRLSFLVGLIFTTILIMAFAWMYVGSGYVDLSVMFFAFMAYYVLIPDLIEKKFDAVNLILASILVASAVLTKQAGFYMLIPLLIWGGILLSRQKLALKNILKWLAISMVTFLIVASPWYAYKAWQVSIGQDFSNVASVQRALVRQSGDISTSERLYQSTKRVAAQLTGQTLRSLHITYPISNGQIAISPAVIILVMLVWLIFLLFAWSNLVARYALLLVGIPFYIIWGAKYSYDYRNLILTLPFFGMAAGFGFMNILRGLSGIFGGNLRKVHHKAEHITESTGTVILRPRFLIAIAVIIGIAVLLYGQFKYSSEELYRMHNQKMRSVGMQWINDPLYDYYNLHGFTGKVRTMYLPMAYLPELKEYTIAVPDTLTLSALKEFEQDPSIHYVLWWAGTLKPDALELMIAKVEKGEYELIFQVRDYVFVRVSE